jgi:acylphosphatase
MKAGAHIIVRGVVQGVGYRWFVRRESARLNLNGFCCNLPDGSVEVEVAGARPAIEDLIRQLRIGPPSADVTDVAVEWKDPGDYPKFEIW